MKIIGDIPNTFTSLASCDSLYMREHAPALAASCALVDNDLHVHMINPMHDDFTTLQVINEGAKKLNDKFRLTVSYEESDLRKLSAEERRTYFACNRFLVANELLALGSDSLFITDVDCLFMQHVSQADATLGLFLREALPGTVGWEREGTKVAAGAVYYHKSIGWFAKEVADIISNNPYRWFLDQAALSRVYQKHKLDIDNFRCFDEKFLDWKFKQGTTIWTGKGARKHDNPIYVSKKKEFENRLANEKLD